MIIEDKMGWELAVKVLPKLAHTTRLDGTAGSLCAGGLTGGRQLESERQQRTVNKTSLDINIIFLYSVF